jgi:capsular polysaccharide biosynthesis protein
MRFATLEQLGSESNGKVRHLATLHPEEFYQADAPISLTGHLARADETHLIPFVADKLDVKSPAIDLYSVTDAVVSPNAAISVGDCIITDSLRPYLHLKDILEQFGRRISAAREDSDLDIRVSNLQRIAAPVLLVRDHGEAGYFHFIHSMLPRLILWQQFPVVDLHLATTTTFQRQFLDYLKIPNERLYIADGRSYFCERAYMITGLVRPDWHTGGFFERPLEVTRLLRRLIPANAEYSGARIYISRSDSKIRAIQNEPDLEDILCKHLGFKSVVLSQFSVEDQIRAFASAAIVVGAHGAGLSNASFMKPGSILFEIFPKSRIWPTFRAIASRAGLRYAAHVMPTTDRYDIEDLTAAIARLVQKQFVIA